MRRRFNTDAESRAIGRRAPSDPSALVALTLARWRRGEGLPAWYAEHLAPRGVDERDFKAVLNVLARGFHWRGNSVLGPRQWSWVCVIDPKAEGDTYVLAVREVRRSHTGPDEHSPRIVIGATTVRPARRDGPEPPSRWDLPRLRSPYSVHPWQAWEELRGRREGADLPSGGYRVDIPEHYYTAFEARFWGVVDAKEYRILDSVEVLPSYRRDIGGAHGCETRGPNPVHADVPTGMMFRWGRTEAPDRVSFPVEEVRMYCGLDPLTGLPPEAEKRANIGLREEDPFDLVIRVLEPLRGMRGFEVIHGTNDTDQMEVVREVLAEWGPFPGLVFKDRGNAVVIGTQNPATMIALAEALRVMHRAGVPHVLDFFMGMTAAIRDKA